MQHATLPPSFSLLDWSYPVLDSKAPSTSEALKPQPKSSPRLVMPSGRPDPRWRETQAASASAPHDEPPRMSPQGCAPQDVPPGCAPKDVSTGCALRILPQDVPPRMCPQDEPLRMYPQDVPLRMCPPGCPQAVPPGRAASPWLLPGWPRHGPSSNKISPAARSLSSRNNEPLSHTPPQ